MRRLALLAVLALSVALLARQSGWTLPVLAESDPPPPLTVAQRVYAIFSASTSAEAQALEALRRASDDRARRDALILRRDALRRDAPELLALAESHPDDPAALDALVWLVHRVSDASEGRRAADLILERYRRNPRLAGVADRLAESGSEPAERVLRGLHHDHPVATVRAEAGYGLARLLKARAERIAWRQPDAARTLTGQARQVLADALALCDDTPADPHALSTRIRAEQAELQTLGIGQPAPEIHGTDIDGRPLRLSDYRGKVVALSFWGDWCSLCWQFFPHQRQLVEQMRGRPFIMLGVSTDSVDEARQAVRHGRVTWPSWVDGGQTRGGPISQAWNVTALPVTFLIDDRGIIRYKVAAQTDDHDTAYLLDSNGRLRQRWQARADELTEVVTALVREAEAHSTQTVTENREPAMAPADAQ
ncbi:MAG: hypothetical protein KatS3mg108_1976 [Isosphaeraceae bacterium]|jgi:peroxiredoxin|nr:MAG: hypothetical protein KatS3mg108_1976 [Isosphaeraceae bacterium]